MDKHIVFFDAACPLCRSVKAVLQKLDWLDRINWFPVQDVKAATRERINRYKDMYDEIYMYTRDKKVLTGYDTVRKILSLLPLTIPLAVLMYLPFAKTIGSPAYRFISKRRYRWFGRVPYSW
ncbi:DUF393 domain-containing protein [Virgibacillus sp. NKC19-3]|uniref:thiol-disulfide oxidoreductase DCC family protein n=1 Tax=Virgibacillus saliphilus TaxID=2831674 RepID=UPI001C9B8230|nr:DUF393 domain-containing protein [Virgibacillus sp. NKC19-3]MBY7144338.1 DUF393 domain-containing protein [Virgibacillus sp. NKC19-3]